MMTPNEVAQHRFSTARFNGYSTSDVDEFLDQLTVDYTALYKENAVLKSKMKVLVDKISEYRATEDDMRKTLLAARQAADSIITEAKAQKEQMLLDVEDEVAAHRQELQRGIENSEAQLAAARQSTIDFAAGMRALVAQQQAYLDRELEFLDRLNEIEAEPKPVEEPVAQEPDELADTLTKMLDDETLAAEMAAAAAAAEADPSAAYEQDMSGVDAITDENEVDEPTRVVDISSAADQDYNV